MINEAGASDIHLIYLLILVSRLCIENEWSFEKRIYNNELYVPLLDLFLYILTHAFCAEVNDHEGHSHDSKQNVCYRDKQE